MCILGSEAIDWLVQHGVPGKTIDRTDAVILGQQLFDIGLFRHVTHSHGFKDAHLFYKYEVWESRE